MRRFLLENGSGETEDDINKEQIIKKAMKSKELEEDNKKLRKLLKYFYWIIIDSVYHNLREIFTK